jgi:phosphoserine aminotransferase
VSRGDTPAILDWKVMEDSLYNTPPCWVIYMCGLVFQHMLEQGGIPAVAQRNQVPSPPPCPQNLR